MWMKCWCNKEWYSNRDNLNFRTKLIAISSTLPTVLPAIRGADRRIISSASNELKKLGIMKTYQAENQRKQQRLNC
jgi:hypothetical protein